MTKVIKNRFIGYEITRRLSDNLLNRKVFINLYSWTKYITYQISRRLVTINIFDDIKRTDPDGVEFWSSRDLSKALEYINYRNFEEVIEKAKQACINSHQKIDDHFVGADEMIELPKSARRQIKSVFLSRFACYLIVQSADPRNEPSSRGQTYKFDRGGGMPQRRVISKRL